MAAVDDKKPDASCVICCSFTCPCFKVKWEKLMSISRVSSKWLRGALCYNLLSIWDHSHVGLIGFLDSTLSDFELEMRHPDLYLCKGKIIGSERWLPPRIRCDLHTNIFIWMDLNRSFGVSLIFHRCAHPLPSSQLLISGGGIGIYRGLTHKNAVQSERM